MYIMYIMAKKLRKPYTILIDPELRQRVATVVVYTPALTVADLVEEALEKDLPLREKALPAKLRRKFAQSVAAGRPVTIPPL
jgi:hypothetical protein